MPFDMLDSFSNWQMREELRQIVSDYIKKMQQTAADPAADPTEKQKAEHFLMMIAVAQMGGIISSR